MRLIRTEISHEDALPFEISQQDAAVHVVLSGGSDVGQCDAQFGCQLVQVGPEIVNLSEHSKFTNCFNIRRSYISPKSCICTAVTIIHQSLF